MNENIKLAIEISTNDFFCTTESIKRFDLNLNKIDIKELIIYSFLNLSGTGLRNLILSTFKYWEKLNYNDWKYIFEEIDGNELAEFYMIPIAKTYLGIDPKFKNSRGLRERLFPKKHRQTKKTLEFIEYSKKDFLGCSHKDLEQDFLNMNYLIEYSNKLLIQMKESYKEDSTQHS